jgi:hypothetical protein
MSRFLKELGKKMDVIAHVNMGMAKAVQQTWLDNLYHKGLEVCGIDEDHAPLS